MKGPKRLLEKKYMSTLLIAAFLVLSALTANNIRMGTRETRENGDTAPEVKETISPVGNRQDDGVDSSGSSNGSGSGSSTNSSSRNARNARSSSVTDSERGTDTEEDTGKNASGEASDTDADKADAGDGEIRTEDRLSGSSAGKSESQTSDHFHFNGSTSLSWPVLGNVILPYSMDTTVYYVTLDQYACNDGILIGARKGEEVKACADGRIVNISETDRYGTMVTMLIGDYYEVQYAQIEDVKYDIGDEVSTGDVIGTVAEPTRSFLLEGPHLFFRMTYKGESVNPAEYLS